MIQILFKNSTPVKLDVSRYIYLGNNALEQLNIIETTHNPSLIKLINNTSTAMGKDFKRETLLIQLKIVKILEDLLYQKSFMIIMLPLKWLANIYDIERLTRRIKLNRLHPLN